MSNKPLNSVDGFSVGNESVANVIDANANVYANSLTVTSVSNLGDLGNVKITGGTTGQVIQTDGAGNLSWGAGAGGAQGLMPFYIPINTTYTISQYQQGLFSIPITVEGTLEVNGILVQV
jgi:hypothetical protein